MQLLPFLILFIDYCGCVTAFPSSITAVCANARPLIEAPVCKVMPVIDSMIPSK